MKKADLVVGREYAIYGGRSVPEGGVAAMTDRHGRQSFPLHGVGRARVEELDVVVRVARGFRSEFTDDVKMIRVTWLENATGRAEVSNERGVYYRDKTLLKSAAVVLCPWSEYIAERNKRAAAVEKEQKQNAAAQAARARVLALLEERGIAATEGRGYRFIAIEASEMERLLGLVSFQAADKVIRESRET